MTQTTIVREDEISLNGQIYRVSGKVIRRLVTRPRKFQIGDTQWNDDQYLSQMSVSDQRGGIGVEEYLKPEHLARCWWSTCDLSHPNHILPHPPATKITQPGAHTAITAPAVWCEFNSKLYMANGRYLMELDAGGTHFDLTHDCDVAITDIFVAPGSVLVVLTASNHIVHEVTTAGAVTAIDDDPYHFVKGISWNDKAFVMSTVGIIYEYTLVTGAVTAKGTMLDGLSPQSLFLYHDADGDQIIYAATTEHLWAHDYANTRFVETNLKYASLSTAGLGALDWNTDAYVSMGLHVKRYSVGSGATSVPVGLDLDDGIPSEYQGEIVKLIDGTDCIYALVDSTEAGTSYYSWVARYDGYGWQVMWEASILDEYVSPTSTTDTDNAWTDDGNTWDDNIATAATTTVLTAAVGKYLEMNIASTVCDGVELYVSDARSYPANYMEVDVYYGAAWHSVYANAYTRAAYTVIEFPQQAITAVRARFTNGGALTETFSIFEVKFHKRYSNQSMTSGIVSDVVARRLWFDVNGDVFYIPLQDYNLLPKKNTAYTYAASAFHITPWYSFDSFVQSKFLDTVYAFVNDCSADETITIKYRYDHSYDDMDTGWTTLATLNADDNDDTSWPLVNNVGFVCNSIQFRFDLVRGSTATNAPDLKAYGISYQRLLKRKYSYQVRITAKDNRRTPHELWDAINTALAYQTKLAFYYRNTIKYVQIYDFSGYEPTGPNYDGSYTLLLMET
jgi:hypothetical protein